MQYKNSQIIMGGLIRSGKTICTANAARRVRHRDVSNEHPLVIQKILSHLNTKNDEVVELLPQQSRAPPQISLFE
jgi:hypothetical protein